MLDQTFGKQVDLVSLGLAGLKWYWAWQHYNDDFNSSSGCWSGGEFGIVLQDSHNGYKKAMG